ncbi:MAG: response regulator [Alphaproteobacteria bacterium]|nr:response regulator [Alphaproteobacteria bacterium]MBT5389446.1 response regulator [Alphaproteobacteria bacterium]MBT5541173.1 response regulator [Alphaproteobacteria bacterium]
MTQELCHLLVVDDDERLRELLSKYLTENGFVVTIASSAQEAREHMGTFLFDLVILDIMMPGETGLEFTISLRKNINVPILLLSAMGEVDDRIKGFEHGADDYLAKPFEPKELLMRIQALLRRGQKQDMALPKDLAFGPFTFDIQKGVLSRQGERVLLTESEKRLLKIMAETPRHPFSRDDLARKAQGDVSPRTIDVQIARLRRKIEDDPRVPKYLQTVRNAGYALWLD